ncbi:hypothetical protein ES288_A11G217800v1 [Gossypium darwinii]|uniref:Uncharacterized protein n=1 Tax=Gossypium darwinii TaxID=34276 RepID=A0A5D2EMA9_GOSDA|nr:hypothetical protein ES288_A11G217800v1 [Gossypium darwinii]
MHIMSFCCMRLGRLVTEEFCGVLAQIWEFWRLIRKYQSSSGIATTLEYCLEFWLFIRQLFTGGLTKNQWQLIYKHLLLLVVYPC